MGSSCVHGLLIALAVGLLVTACTAPPKDVPPAFEACAEAVAASGWRPPLVKNHEAATFDELLEELAAARVILIGEQHERYDHHLTQLEIICRLHRIDPALAIGVEFVQTPYQRALDGFLSGGMEADAFLTGSEYYERWQYDFRLYAPILELARLRHIPVIALNVPAEITRKVAAGGMSAIAPEDGAWVAPGMTPPADPSYRARLRAVFDRHPQTRQPIFEHFLSAQLLWDEGMAYRAAQYLKLHPLHKLVVLAGDGHVSYRNAIPDRLARAIDAPVVSLSQPSAEIPDRADADFTLRSTTPLALPRQGQLGVLLDAGVQGVAIGGFAADSAGRDAGMRVGDRIIRINSREVRELADLRIALWRALPGDRASVLSLRAGEPIGFDIELR